MVSRSSKPGSTPVIVTGFPFFVAPLADRVVLPACVENGFQDYEMGMFACTLPLETVTPRTFFVPIQHLSLFVSAKLSFPIRP